MEAVHQPANWAGRLVSHDHRLGPTEKLVRQALDVARRGVAAIEVLVKFAGQHGIRRDNLLTTIDRMVEMGDVVPIRRNGTIRTLRLFRYDTIH